jgi:tetratricopeptide (TPR) repeat protein
MRFTSTVWLSALFFLVPFAHACLWLQGTTIDGHLRKDTPYQNPEELERRIAAIPDKAVELFHSFEYRPDNPAARANDEAVKVLLRGDAKAAVKMLSKAEAEHPGVYYTAANLGTAYELAGDDESALKWILEGIKRNPDSHMRTEWLHARILEAKIHMKSDHTWLSKHTLSGVNFAQLRSPDYFLDTAQRRVPGASVPECLYLQLSARMLFVKPKDPVVAELLWELAFCEAYVGTLEKAVGYARLSINYGQPEGDLKPSIESWLQIIEKTKQARPAFR